jgi:hypothetical protein
MNKYPVRGREVNKQPKAMVIDMNRSMKVIGREEQTRGEKED